MLLRSESWARELFFLLSLTVELYLPSSLTVELYHPELAISLAIALPFSFFYCFFLFSLFYLLRIWSKRIRTFACRYQKPMPYHLAILHMAWVRGGSEERAVQGRGDIASKQKGSPFRTDYNKLTTLIERKGKLSALFACNAMPIKVGERFCNLDSLRCSTELVGSTSTESR